MSSDEEIVFCSRCGIPLPDDVTHDEPKMCIAELRRSLKRQSKAAENLAFEVSTRLLGILEGLAHDPELAGVRFSTRNPDTGERCELAGQIVIGVMTAIYREYQKAGDWSPLNDANKRVVNYKSHGFKLFSLLNSVMVLHEDGERLPDALVEEIAETLAASTQLGFHLPGLDHS